MDRDNGSPDFCEIQCGERSRIAIEHSRLTADKVLPCRALENLAKGIQRQVKTEALSEVLLEGGQGHHVILAVAKGFRNEWNEVLDVVPPESIPVDLENRQTY